MTNDPVIQARTLSGGPMPSYGADRGDADVAPVGRRHQVFNMGAGSLRCFDISAMAVPDNGYVGDIGTVPRAFVIEAHMKVFGRCKDSRHRWEEETE